MSTLNFEAQVRAPIERCFDLSRNIDFHTSLEPKHTAVAGVTTGLIGREQTIVWSGSIFGFPVSHTSLVDEFERPHYFRDVMVKGLFKKYVHQHFLGESDGVTTMRDVIDFEAPYGPFGKIADALFVRGYLTHLLTNRNKVLKRVAESEEWKRYLPRP